MTSGLTPGGIETAAQEYKLREGFLEVNRTTKHLSKERILSQVLTEV